MGGHSSGVLVFGYAASC